MLFFLQTTGSVPGQTVPTHADTCHRPGPSGFRRRGGFPGLRDQEELALALLRTAVWFTALVQNEAGGAHCCLSRVRQRLAHAPRPHTEHAAGMRLPPRPGWADHPPEKPFEGETSRPRSVPRPRQSWTQFPPHCRSRLPGPPQSERRCLRTGDGFTVTSERGPRGRFMISMTSGHRGALPASCDVCPPGTGRVPRVGRGWEG